MVPESRRSRRRHNSQGSAVSRGTIPKGTTPEEAKHSVAHNPQRHSSQKRDTLRHDTQGRTTSKHPVPRRCDTRGHSAHADTQRGTEGAQQHDAHGAETPRQGRARPLWLPQPGQHPQYPNWEPRAGLRGQGWEFISSKGEDRAVLREDKSPFMPAVPPLEHGAELGCTSLGRTSLGCRPLGPPTLRAAAPTSQLPPPACPGPRGQPGTRGATRP